MQKAKSSSCALRLNFAMRCVYFVFCIPCPPVPVRAGALCGPLRRRRRLC